MASDDVKVAKLGNNMPKTKGDANKLQVERYFKNMAVEFKGPADIKTASNNIANLNDLEVDFRIYAYDNKLVEKEFPLAYWKDLFNYKIKQERTTAFRKLAAELAYRPEKKEDGKAALESFMYHLTGQHDPIDVVVMQQFLWLIKRKLNELPTSYHIMPILYGGQGTGKSTAIALLTKPLMAYTIKGKSVDFVTDERQFKTMSEYFLVIFDEMAKANKVDINHLKNIITNDALTWRQLHTNNSASMSQNCTFIGSSNKSVSDIIIDDTGMRRFYQIDVKQNANFTELNKIDVKLIWESINEHQDQAYTAVPEILASLTLKQEELRTPGSVEDFLSNCRYTKGTQASTDKVRLQEIFDEYLKYCEMSNIAYSVTKQSFSRHLQEKGWIKIKDDTKKAVEFKTTISNIKPMNVIDDLLTKKGLDS